MSEKAKMLLARADMIAERFMQKVAPYCQKICVAGSVRRRCSEVGDIEFVVVAKDEFSMGQAFPEGYPGLKVNGSRLKRFVYPEKGIQIELYITTLADYGRILAIRTGSSAYSHIELAIRWGRLGWAGTEDGLRRKIECDKKSTWRIKPEYKNCPTLPPVFDTEEKFYDFLGIEWIPPIKRSWKSKHEEINYKL